MEAFSEILRIPKMWTSNLTLIIVFISIGFMEPTLSLYCKKEYDMSISEVGYAFSTATFVYACFTPILG